MRKIILNLASSIDGYIEGIHGEFDWCFTDQDYSDGQFEHFDTVLMGRKSFELMIKMNEMPMKNVETFIFSNTLESSEYGTIVNSEDIVEKVMEMKKKDICSKKQIHSSPISYIIRNFSRHSKIQR